MSTVSAWTSERTIDVRPSIKVGRGDILIYFNEIFDCLSKVS